MIPVNLHIRGFLSYKEPANINFEGLHLASITGANGAGKSSILDAITWALFGIARARNDQIINQQSDTAIVSLDFLYEHQNFRIRRTKPLEKTMVLEFYIFDPETKDWRSITEHSMQETQKRIISTLRMDYNTFTNASFFLQGKADQFTQLSPGERKDILSNILGLEIWEEYLIRARELRKNLEVEEKSIYLAIDNILIELAKEEQSKAKLEEEEKEYANKKTLKEKQNDLLEQARQLEKAKDKIESQINQLEKDLKKIQSSIEKNKEREQGLLSEQERHSKYLENSKQIEEKYSKWQSTRIALDDWNHKFSLFHKANQNLVEINNQIKSYLNNLASQKEVLEGKLAKVQEYQTQIPILEEEFTTLNKTQSELSSSISQKNKYIEERMKIQKDISEKNLTIDHLQNLNKEKRQKLIEFRGAGPECPFCMQPLSKEHREKYESLVIAEGLERKQAIELHQNELISLKSNLADIDKALKKIDSDERLLRELMPKISEKQVLISNIKKEVSEWETKDGLAYASILEKLEKQEELQPLLSEKEKYEKELQTIGYDETKHHEVKNLENELRSVEIEYQNLISAKTKMEPIPAQLNEIRNEISLYEAELQEKSALLEALQFDYQDQYSNLPNIASIRKELDVLDIEISQISNRIGAEKQKLDTIANKKIEKTQLEALLSNLSIQINRYKKIEDAFGKNGVPALLIEQALPEIEMHANELLDRLSNSQLSIHFETQSEYKDKKRKDKKETLEILINDAFGHTRAYEMFSGGEAFRINFAIRLALSQVLAKRSGARLETLVVDEGFGSQDHLGISRLVETINLIKKDFAKVLIITHLEELKDAFPARIEVEKTINGSKVEVMVY